MSELTESLAKVVAVPIAMSARQRLILETILEARHSPVGDLNEIQTAAAKLLALDIEIALAAEERRIKRLNDNAPALLALLQELHAAHERAKTDEGAPGEFFTLKIEQALSKAERLIAKVRGDSI